MRLVRQLLLNITTPRFWFAGACVLSGYRRPGLTNAVTGVAGAWQESRDLLILGGQEDVGSGGPGSCQSGIQEVDGGALCSITKVALRIDSPAQLDEALALRLGNTRKGPVFLELPLDVQAAAVDAAACRLVDRPARLPIALDRQQGIAQIAARLPRLQGRCCLSAV